MAEGRSTAGKVYVESVHDPIPTGDEVDDLEWLARWMDSVFAIPGLRLRFGLDALIGLLPGVGDTATFLVSLYILSTAQRLGVPRIAILRMGANLGIDLLFGAIPFVGDLFDVYWKSNQRNVALLRKYQAANTAERRQLRWHDRLFVVSLIVGLLLILVASIAATIWMVARIGSLLVPAKS